MSDTPFATLLETPADDTGAVTVEVPPDWAQGRATFGGLQAALALRAMRRALQRLPIDAEGARRRRPRSLLVSFFGPLRPGLARVEANWVRSGRSVTQLRAEIGQLGGPEAEEPAPAAMALCCFGAARDSRLELAGRSRPEVPDADGLIDLPYIEGVTPRFTKHFAYRWAIGKPPFCGAPPEERALGGWCRFREPPPAETSEEWILALVDAWPAPVLPLLDRPAPASSLTWAMEFPASLDADDRTDGWWLFRSEVEAAAGGYASTRCKLWSPSGKLAAISRQAVAYFG